MRNVPLLTLAAAASGAVPTIDDFNQKTLAVCTDTDDESDPNEQRFITLATGIVDSSGRHEAHPRGPRSHNREQVHGVLSRAVAGCDDCCLLEQTNNGFLYREDAQVERERGVDVATWGAAMGDLHCSHIVTTMGCKGSNSREAQHEDCGQLRSSSH
jgi:hypothetical protein